MTELTGLLVWLTSLLVVLLGAWWALSRP
jgi:hypothetical protein